MSWNKIWGGFLWTTKSDQRLGLNGLVCVLICFTYHSVCVSASFITMLFRGYAPNILSSDYSNLMLLYLSPGDSYGRLLGTSVIIWYMWISLLSPCHREADIGFNSDQIFLVSRACAFLPPDHIPHGLHFEHCMGGLWVGRVVSRTEALSHLTPSRSMCVHHPSTIGDS